MQLKRIAFLATNGPNFERVPGLAVRISTH